MQKVVALEDAAIDYREINEKIEQYKAVSEKFIVDSIKKTTQRLRSPVLWLNKITHKA